MDDAVAHYKQDPHAFDIFKPFAQTDDLNSAPSAFTAGETGFKNADHIVRLATAAVLTGDKTYWDALERWVPVLESYEPVTFTKLGGDNHDLVSGHVLNRLSIAYDLLHGRGDPRLVRRL